MQRTAINPSSWSVKLGFDQAQLVEGHRRQLICSAQDAVDANGNSQHPGDMAAQLGLALDNLEVDELSHRSTGGPYPGFAGPNPQWVIARITADRVTTSWPNS